MAEGQVTIGESSHILPRPFFVLATQNPIEQEGTYPLPEAELDRFLLKLQVPYPTLAEEARIVTASASGALQNASDAKKTRVEPVFAPEACIASERMPIPSGAMNLSFSTSFRWSPRPASPERTQGAESRDDYQKYISFGASPRASIALHSCAKIRALFEGRDFVLPEDVKAVAPAVLRHRLVLSYEAGADGLSADDIVARILSLVSIP